jgi:hypothetical protein
MKKLSTLLLGLALAGSVASAAPVTYFQEDFSNGLSKWKLVDVDQKDLDLSSIETKTGVTISEAKQSWFTIQYSEDFFLAASAGKFTPTGTADDWMISQQFEIKDHAYVYWSDAAFDKTQGETYEVYISTTGNEVTDFKTKLGSFTISGGANRLVDLSALNVKNQKVYLAFRNTSNDKYVTIIYNVGVFTPDANDSYLYTSDVNKFYQKDVSTKFNTLVVNNGFTPITSVEVNYQIDDKPVVTSVVSNLDIQYNKYAQVEVPTAWKSTDLGYHYIKIWTSKLNGAADDNLTNDTLSYRTFVYDNSNSTTKYPLIEHFTSSTCGPCADNNKLYFNDLYEANKSNMTIIKYQMNWPTPPGDPYYTAEGGVRKTYYSVGSVPTIFGNGEAYPLNSTNRSQAGIDALQGLFSYYKINTPTFSVLDSLVSVKANLECLFGLAASSDITAHVAIIEFKTTKNKKTNGETEFHYVMKKMLPNASGTIVTALDKSATQALNLSYKFPVGNTVEEFTDLGVVIFVQDNNTKEILQSAWAVKTEPSDVKDDNSGNGVVAMGPNPAIDATQLKYFVANDQNVKVQVYSIDGAEVINADLGLQTTGYYDFNVNTSNLNSGAYIVKLSIGSHEYNRTLNVIK